MRFETWEAALVAASSQASAATPSVIVLDEFPDLCDLRRDGDGRVTGSPQEGSVRTAWDQVLSRRPVLLILIGSDLSMMEALTSYGRPLHQRPTRELVVPPLNPREVAAISKRAGADALEAYLVTGGFPKIAAAWQEGDLRTFLTRSLVDDGSPLVSTGRLILEAEFRSSVQARSVLSAIGTGSRTNKAISDASGITTNNLTYPLKVLADKRVVSTSLPLSTRPSVDRRYAVSDPYLRFYLRFLDQGYGEIERGRGRVLVPGIIRSWETYLGLAIEPIVRVAIENLLPDDRFGSAQAVGGFWTRDHRVEVDLVGADRGEPPVERSRFHRLDQVAAAEARHRIRRRRAHPTGSHDRRRDAGHPTRAGQPIGDRATSRPLSLRASRRTSCSRPSRSTEEAGCRGTSAPLRCGRCQRTGVRLAPRSCSGYPWRPSDGPASS